ncbi:MAG: glutamate-1-semialdehyde 2,1-aminomutase [Ignavibacteriae bacterium]|nr:glutamate-1-semialdehyde 2,1-aminomutase [Ignavibacteriota bacterium]
MKTLQSDFFFERAKQLIPGGVNSPVRAFKSVGGNPLFIKRALGSRLWDVDGNEFIDYVGTWGPAILGHSHPRVVDAITKAVVDGTSFGAPTELELKMAELICKLVPSVEMVRMVNSGTEATMSAVRLARAFTGKEKLIKFEGCYHGHGDSFLIKAGSGAMTFGVPDSPGVPSAVAAQTLTAQFNSLTSVQQLVDANKAQIAAIIVEPVVGNMGCIPPLPGFLEGLRSLCTKENIILIFDEVMTGFRLAPGGAQELFNIKPDLSTFGKIIGGGLPVGAYGGKKEIMQLVAPSGPMYQAGTLSGNPLAMTAGFETLSIIQEEKHFYEQLESKSKLLADGIATNVKQLGVPIITQRVGSMSTLFFTSKPVIDCETALSSDTKRFATYFRAMLEMGVYLAPSQFEAGFVSIAHTEDDIRMTIAANRKALEAAWK